MSEITNTVVITTEGNAIATWEPATESVSALLERIQAAGNFGHAVDLAALPTLPFADDLRPGVVAQDNQGAVLRQTEDGTLFVGRMTEAMLDNLLARQDGEERVVIAAVMDSYVASLKVDGFFTAADQAAMDELEIAMKSETTLRAFVDPELENYMASLGMTVEEALA